MGLIYKITAPSNRSFIGHTTESIEEMWMGKNGHVKIARKNLRTDSKILHKAIKKYGDKNFKIEVLEEYFGEFIDEKVIEYIVKLRTLVPYGMNKNDKIILPIQEIIVSDEDIQKYIIKLEDGYQVINHPMGPNKTYFSRLKTNEEKYKKALKYVFKLNNLSEPIKIEKKDKIPEIKKRRNGYSVHLPLIKTKYFVTKGVPLETLYQEAIQFLNINKSKSLVQRLNDNAINTKIKNQFAQERKNKKKQFNQELCKKVLGPKKESIVCKI